MDQVQQASEQISQFLAKDMKIWNAPCIYAYYPCHQEASILPFVRRMLEKGKKLAFPRVKGEEMEFYAVEDMDAFQKGSFGIMEPIGQHRFVKSRQWFSSPVLYLMKTEIVWDMEKDIMTDIFKAIRFRHA